MAVECSTCGKICRSSTALKFHEKIHSDATRQDTSGRASHITRQASSVAHQETKPYSIAQSYREQAEAEEQELRRARAERQLRLLREQEQADQRAKEEEENQKWEKERQKEIESKKELLSHFSKSMEFPNFQLSTQTLQVQEEKELCKKCFGSFPLSALEDCDRCEKPFCDDCLIECEDCGGLFCERCFDNHDCVED